MYRLFGPYWLLRRIGLGEMAEVFVATRTSGEDEPGASEAPAADGPLGLVAVKRISREMSRYDEILELFAREGELAARFDHPKVARVFDVGEVGQHPYIAMEYVPGGDLAHLLDRIAPHTLPPGLAVRVVLDVCEALEYVHDVADERGLPLHVVHGDLTPSNILVSTSGVAKLIDFSVASSGIRDPGDTTVRGTYAYMSPEQVRGQAIDRRTDVFAVGVLLWELLSGKRLFRRAANYLTLAAVVEEPVPLLAELDTGMDAGGGVAELDALLSRALAKDRDQRYSRIGELAAELGPLAERLGWDLRPWTLKTKVRELLSEHQARQQKRPATEPAARPKPDAAPRV
jgi:eukaryotic-like serine/threonine-protein kinase